MGVSIWGMSKYPLPKDESTSAVSQTSIRGNNSRMLSFLQDWNADAE